MDQENFQEETGVEESRGHLEPLKKVTPLPKYLALILFIILPFLGGWIGYTYAPEKVVEVERIVVKEVVLNDKQISELIPDIESISDDDLYYFKDKEIGISFYYPNEWGDLIEDGELVAERTYDNIAKEYVEFDCSAEYDNDPCELKFLFFDDGNRNLFLAAESIGYHENPVARGGFWGDYAGGIGSDYLSVCEESTKCNIVTSENGVVLAHYKADPLPAEMGYQPERYYLHNPSSSYYGLVFSAYRLYDSSLTAEYAQVRFDETIIKTLSLIE